MRSLFGTQLQLAVPIIAFSLSAAVVAVVPAECFVRTPSDRLLDLLRKRHRSHYFEPLPKSEYMHRISATRLPDACGCFKGGGGGRVEAFKDVKWQSSYAQGSHEVQFELTRESGVETCHFVQFVRAWELDTQKKPICKEYTANGTFHMLGEWYLDTEWFEEVDQSVFYDALGARNRTLQELSIFDSPRNTWHWGDHSKIGMDFVVYIVVDGCPCWEIKWNFVAEVEVDGVLKWKVREALGREVDHFPPPFDEKTWKLGYRTRDRYGNLSEEIDVPVWLAQVY